MLLVKKNFQAWVAHTISKITRAKRTLGVAQVVECLLCSTKP
jgi:hypothetical protein